MLKANHSKADVNFNGEIVHLNNGEFVTGRDALAFEYNQGSKREHQKSGVTLWKWLKKFENLRMLNIKSTTKYSVISIIGWGEYQETEQQENNKGTTREQQQNTNKNVKNDKNDQEETTTTDRQKVFNFFEQGGFGQLGGFQIQNIDEEINDFTTAGSPEPEHMVVLGLQEALNNNVRKWSYARAVMHSWQDNKVLSAKDVEAYKASHRPQDGAFSQPQGDESDDLPF
ncbi:DnaD domain protein [Furfurilactobacillus rossiae]|uniref:DnaB/C C-terminal domain-containing protein n=1 Tax=Furfurilactobacillus rossiae DSM 15814 TaxID=1114972 RepID=A0A0R1RTU7_9LACO|nr:DnaD domain protein [Furfurilactobacillus rossiae]KRL56643.1 hypothetical protein FD35_GL001739 [Furfurilactobacillus rossiae DSM 15814]QFR66456.1 DnaD domain protein [Furfurilactobacillus rossiae]